MLRKFLHLVRKALSTFSGEQPDPHLQAIGRGLIVWLVVNLFLFVLAYFFFPGPATIGDTGWKTTPWAAASAWIISIAAGVRAGYREWPTKDNK